MVLIHEFGHQLACRRSAEKLMTSSFGLLVVWRMFLRRNVRRQLWSIAAGPLVNVALIPVISIRLVAGDIRRLA